MSQQSVRLVSLWEIFLLLFYYDAIIPIIITLKSKYFNKLATIKPNEAKGVYKLETLSDENSASPEKVTVCDLVPFLYRNLYSLTKRYSLNNQFLY